MYREWLLFRESCQSAQKRTLLLPLAASLHAGTPLRYFQNECCNGGHCTCK